MALPLSNTCEGGTDETVVTTGNSGGASGDAFDTVSASGTSTVKYDTAAEMHGALSIRHDIDGSGNVTGLSWGTSLGSQTDFYARFYIFRSATPSNQHRLVRFADSPGGTEAGRISWHTDGKIYSFDSTLVVPPASSFTLTANQWLRWEVHLVASTTAGVIEVKAYVGDSTSEIGTYTRTGLNTLSAIGELRIGNTVTDTVGSPFWTDDFALATGGYIGPSGSAGTPGPPLQVVTSPLRW